MLESIIWAWCFQFANLIALTIDTPNRKRCNRNLPPFMKVNPGPAIVTLLGLVSNTLIFYFAGVVIGIAFSVLGYLFSRWILLRSDPYPDSIFPFIPHSSSLNETPYSDLLYDIGKAGFQPTSQSSNPDLPSGSSALSHVVPTAPRHPDDDLVDYNKLYKAN